MRKMRKNPNLLFTSLCLSLSLSLVKLATASTPHREVNLKLEETIGKVRSESSLTARTQAAEHLAELTRKTNAAYIDNKTISDIASLLDIPEDSVQAWVASALGHIGRRASSAAPRLLALLPVSDCLQGDLTSSAFIRPALKQMGVKPPPARSYNDCQNTK